jgi:hypothetical protein
MANNSPLPFTLNNQLPTMSNSSVSVLRTHARAALQPLPQTTVLNSVPPPPPPPPNRPPSDTNSDDSIIMNNTPASEFAEVKQKDQTKPLILTVGKITPKVLYNFADGCDAYFFHKQIAVDKQVQAVILRLKDHRICDWYCPSKATIIAMTFVDFMSAVQKKLLQDGWEYNLNVKILSSTQGAKPFSKWETEVGSE